VKATIVGYRVYKAYARFSGILPISTVEGGGFDKTLFFSGDQTLSVFKDTLPYARPEN
jgi:hypothetical protein